MQETYIKNTNITYHFRMANLKVGEEPPAIYGFSTTSRQGALPIFAHH
jgi:hypothetical protein